MIREIKFRAWNDGEILHDVGVTPGSDAHIPYLINGDEYDNIDYYPEAILMQYTGLKDKNGMEIYEGDILSAELRGTGRTLPGEVKSHASGAWLVGEGGELWQINERTEVIGNIYENHELLNGN